MSIELLPQRPRAASARSCGTCGMCCKVFKISAVEKAAGEWCRNFRTGQGCGIYEARPHQCRLFNCYWMTDATLPDEWKPDRAKFVLSIFPQNGFLYVQVDPGAPMAWRKEPYYSGLKRWARTNAAKRRHVIVFVQDEATLILPEQDVRLGKMRPGEGFSLRMQFGPDGPYYAVEREGGTQPAETRRVANW